jgi:uncharacterized protein YacL
MDLLEISCAVVWIDFFTIVISKFFNLGKSLDKWYEKFGFVAAEADCLVIILGIMVAKFIFPSASLMTLVLAAIVIQIIHDIAFYYLVIRVVPTGQNSMIDLFKEYAVENSWKILVADSIMIGSTVLLADYLSTLKTSYTTFIGLLGTYALTYMIYTK